MTFDPCKEPFNLFQSHFTSLISQEAGLAKKGFYPSLVGGKGGALERRSGLVKVEMSEALTSYLPAVGYLP